MSKQCPIECEEFGVSNVLHPFVIVPECPANLAGRDLLCALGLTIICTKNGLKLKKSDPVDDSSAVVVSHSPTASSYEYCWNIDFFISL